MVAAQVRAEDSFAVEEQVVLFRSSDYLSGLLHPQYDVSPDDQRFVMLRPLGTDEPGSLILVQNLFEELQKRVGG